MTTYADKLLNQIREYIEEVNWCLDNVNNYNGGDFKKVSSAFESLDEWLKNGGELPQEWKSKKKTMITV